LARASGLFLAAAAAVAEAEEEEEIIEGRWGWAIVPL
jgi:hypothetical protein